MARSRNVEEMKRPTLRCAIYTRKSSEEGLEQDFNSLDAQREACEAYILSQRHEGWTALPQMYDDGGVSGGTMERPSLIRLLADIKAGKIDIVVVYKVDRLTRSLADFAKIVEIFDKQTISFVSVTQAFNTTSSMGRLTLNVLLSFAQFEREVTGERIRDKIAASKKKGMWMGGQPPLGYDVQDRKLIVNEGEADTVRLIFEQYARLKSVRSLQHELDRRGIVSKARRLANGTAYGAKPLGRGALYAMLSNRIYRGEIMHKGTAHPGQHDAIVDEAIWLEVQQIFADNRVNREQGTNADEPSLLAGLLFDAAGDRMTPTHANKNGTRYRYYVSASLIRPNEKSSSNAAPADRSSGQRLSARNLERLVQDRLKSFLAEPAALIEHLCDGESAVEQRRLIACAEYHAGLLKDAAAKDWRQLLMTIVANIQVHPDRVNIQIDKLALRMWLLRVDDAGSGSATTMASPGELNNHSDAAGRIVLSIPVALHRAGNEMRLIVPGATNYRAPDPSLVGIIARAHSIRDRLFENPDMSVQGIATADNLTMSYVTRVLRLAFLAPDIVNTILNGRQPLGLTAKKLMADTRLPMDWAEQRALLGFERQSMHQ
jgi:site-specific DNA recombinase